MLQIRWDRILMCVRRYGVSCLFRICILVFRFLIYANSNKSNHRRSLLPICFLLLLVPLSLGSYIECTVKNIINANLWLWVCRWINNIQAKQPPLDVFFILFFSLSVSKNVLFSVNSTVRFTIVVMICCIRFYSFIDRRRWVEIQFQYAVSCRVFIFSFRFWKCDTHSHQRIESVRQRLATFFSLFPGLCFL